MAETFGCCGFHLDCQRTGKCKYESGETAPFNYQECMLYNGVIKYRFPPLYQLKQKGFIEIESNHLTEKGIEEMGNSDGRLFMMLNIVFILGLGHNSRIYPQDIHKKLVTAIKVLNI